ncbi:MAG: Rne/Rng family ribonuclease [Crocinitomicaceae bacterium]
MSVELVVDSKPSGVVIALLKDGKLVELHEENGQIDYAVGDLYLGRVRKIVPSLNAAFVDVGYEKDAFLHYLDLGPQFSSLNEFTKNTLNKKQKSSKLSYFKLSPDIDKNGKIEDVLSASQPILVQVAKEPISSKGPRLSSEVTIAGRFLVLVPFSNKVSISQKIKSHEERDRLREIVKGILPKNFGVIIRTVAENKKVSEIDSDLNDLIKKWEKMHNKLKFAKPPKRVLGELNRSSSLLRDMLNESFTNIHVNDTVLKDELHKYISSIAPGREKILKHYSGKVNIFERFGVNKQIKSLFGKKVPLSGGGYLIIEHTEAMHVIDVNSGYRKGAEDNQEDNAITVNIEAAEEIARILRLRDMGGIITIDFIDMHKRENNKILHEKFKEFMKGDRAKHNILPPSKFGIIEVTRQRVRPETEIRTAESCPTCNGTGEVQASILLAEQIENNLKYLIKDRKEPHVSLVVHPYLEAYFTKGLFSKRWKWYRSMKKWVSIRPNSSFHLLQYKFVDKKNEEISL